MDRQREKSKGSKGQVYRTFGSSSLPDSYAMLMEPNKAKTAAHGCHC